MTEKRQELIKNVFAIFSIVDKLDEIGDSDYDNEDLLKKFKRSRNAEINVQTNKTTKSKNNLVGRADQKCDNVWTPTKGLMDGQNPLEVLPNEQFVRTYRFSKECVEDILQMISYGLTKFTNRGKPFSPMVQLLITLQFLATGMVSVILSQHFGRT